MLPALSISLLTTDNRQTMNLAKAPISLASNGTPKSATRASLCTRRRKAHPHHPTRRRRRVVTS